MYVFDIDFLTKCKMSCVVHQRWGPLERFRSGSMQFNSRVDAKMSTRIPAAKQK
jgi:hypothetical protein